MKVALATLPMLPLSEIFAWSLHIINLQQCALKEENFVVVYSMVVLEDHKAKSYPYIFDGQESSPILHF